MTMRKPAEWMCSLDERILEYLNDEPWTMPHVLEHELSMDASEKRIRERCQLLADADLIEPIHSEMYELTTWGRLYLEGEVDARNQPRPRPERVL